MTREERLNNRKCKLAEKYQERIEVAYLFGMHGAVPKLKKDYEKKRERRFGKNDPSVIITLGEDAHIDEDGGICINLEDDESEDDTYWG